MKRVIYIFTAIFFLMTSCGDEVPRQTIPYAPVNFRVDLNSYDLTLSSPLSYKEFTDANRRIATDRYGYGGVLVVTNAQGQLHAFDRCCPHEDKKTHVVAVDYPGNVGYQGKVKCPTCGSVFVTMFGIGNVESGPSLEPLQRYNVIALQDGSFRIVN